MPEFRLEAAPRQVKVRNPRLLFTKNEYIPQVKVTDWEKYAQRFPIDNDPYCIGSLNYHLSHYNRIGNGPEEPFVTETHHMLSQLSLKDDVKRLFHNPNRYMVNYYTYNDTLACEVDLSDKLCPSMCAGSFDTTMQRSYTPPHPYIMQRLSFPKIPFMLHRKYKWKTNTTNCPYKFLDDGYLQQVRELQCIKKSKMISYNPMTLMNSDGTLPHEKQRECVNLQY